MLNVELDEIPIKELVKVNKDIFKESYNIKGLIQLIETGGSVPLINVDSNLKVKNGRLRLAAYCIICEDMDIIKVLRDSG